MARSRAWRSWKSRSRSRRSVAGMAASVRSGAASYQTAPLAGGGSSRYSQCVMHPVIDPNDAEQCVERAVHLLGAAKRVAVLTGAGVSAESGIPTFRDADGLWEGHPVEQVATPAAFRRDPKLVWKF